MSLAEPRKRKKNPMHSINLAAPNHWTNDDSKFGQRMLEKFGWSKGSGLGKNHQGISENIKIQHKVTPTGLGFIANNADDWFKAGEDYSRLLSQLTEKFEQYQTLSEATDQTSKKSLVQNSLNSKSRVHYHKFTKGKDLTQYKREELACILGKGVKEDDQNPNGLDIKEYFKTKRESKKTQIGEHDTSDNKDVTVPVDEEVNERITVTYVKDTVEIKTDEYEISTIPTKKKKRESKQIKETEILPPLPSPSTNECENVNSKTTKKSQKVLSAIGINEAEQSIKKKSKSLVVNDTDVKEGNGRDNDKCSNAEEQVSELVLTHKYQNLVDLLIENSSAGKKYCKNSTSDLLFEKKMKEFADSVKHQCATTVGSTEMKPIEKQFTSNKPMVLNPDEKNFVKNFETQKSKTLENILKGQRVVKYINEKSMFIAKHGDVLFFGSNINDIKGYGNW